MKKIFLLVILSAALIFNSAQAKTSDSTAKTQVKAKPAAAAKTVKAKPASVAKPVKAKVAPKIKAAAATSKYKTTMKWDASGLKYLNTPSHFDYSSAIRNAVIKKIENYARRNKIKVITLAVIKAMRE